MENRQITYAAFSTVAVRNQTFWLSTGEGYEVYFAFDGLVCFAGVMEASDLVHFETNLKLAQNQVATVEDGTVLAKHAAKSPRTSDGKVIASQWPTEGKRNTLISPNWCDPTTWYNNAVRVVDELAVDSGDHLTYILAHQNVIDLYHGKVTQEDFLCDGGSNSYRVVVKVNGVSRSERNPHFGVGGDFVCDYRLGKVTFTEALESSDVVLVTYHYENGSTWIIRPEPGYVLKIGRAEVQFSGDVGINDTVKFQVYVGGAPYGNATTYKTMIDYINEANGAYPSIPVLGGDGWRGCSQPVYTYPWQYASLIELRSSYGAEIRIFLEHDTAFSGAVATATFYCLSTPE